MRVQAAIIAGLSAAAFMFTIASTVTSNAAPLHCPKGYKCIPESDPRYQGFFPTDQPTATNESTDNGYIKPESGISGPHTPGW